MQTRLLLLSRPLRFPGPSLVDRPPRKRSWLLPLPHQHRLHRGPWMDRCGDRCQDRCDDRSLVRNLCDDRSLDADRSLDSDLGADRSRDLD